MTVFVRFSARAVHDFFRFVIFLLIRFISFSERVTDMRRFYHLCPGDTGPMTELLQLGLARAGLDVGVSGVFDRDTASALREFQSRHCIDETGVADAKTRRALMPYLTGYRRVTAEKGDTLKKLADRYGADPAALRTANPALCNRRRGSG
jgi:peptidoglycan hydrolase-like protein with peptidoglycan-binding domain